MDLQTLKAQHPAIYAAACEEGAKAEKDRVVAHLEFLDVAKETALASIKDGTQYLNNAAIQAKYMSARMNAAEIKGMEEESPPPVNPGEAEKPTEGGEDQKNEESVKTCAAAKELLKGFI